MLPNIYVSLIHIRIKGEVSTVKHVSSPVFFTDRSKAVLLLWVILICLFV